ncbi:hypothetical protein BDN72DRAFT_649274 [Pluteus cervinus]|uniref:Uncharacterized protein n=1 Tax=Pluteus cervinus TaxID=181527 RepID=A0ACD3ATZ3_9AGAR|nr:hypothetical protein BDN72DRAFT_649274 [Pluteus cervinus]
MFDHCHRTGAFYASYNTTGLYASGHNFFYSTIILHACETATILVLGTSWLVGVTKHGSPWHRLASRIRPTRSPRKIRQPRALTQLEPESPPVATRRSGVPFTNPYVCCHVTETFCNGFSTLRVAPRLIRNPRRVE